ncbi:lyase family protein [Marinomonas sp. RS-M-Aa-14]|uniref:lyase family protein n=1 Tax=Marinomonas sp. RS-M-Aa-14 TaxID=3241169 RepID=UPI003AABC3BC
MSSSIIDSKLFAPLFLSDAMNAVFSDKARVQSYVDVEAALARAQASVGMIPQAAADAINRTAETVSLDMVQLAIDTGNVGYPILGLVRQLSGAAGDAGRFVHWGATTQDIMDTGSVLQIRNGIQLIEQEPHTNPKGFKQASRDLQKHGDGWTNPYATCAADHLWL